MKPQDVTYIICYRDASEERRIALIFTLNWLWNCFPDLEVVIVEQDVESKLNFELPPNCKKTFVYNDSLFNRSWAFNVVARNSKKELLVFSDSDIFLKKEDYEKCFNTCEKFDMCKPNLALIYNVQITSHNQLIYEILNERKLYTIAGGLIFMRREAFLRVGGWDERFEGWGGEDAALSKLIINKMKFSILNLDTFHIDHDRSQAKKDETFLYNWNLAQEIGTYAGSAIDHYITRLQSSGLGNPNKYKQKENTKKEILNFVLAISTYNRKEYLQSMLTSFLVSRSKDVEWKIIIADDGSKDGTIDFIKIFDFEGIPYVLLQNQRNGIHHQMNTILFHLSNSKFDVCFKCDDDVFFKQKGWDKLYWETMERTGYQHLIFIDKTWIPADIREKPLKFGNLISNGKPGVLSGAMYTITPEIIKKVGYFDVFNFGFRGVGHQDYSLRCCRAGFNAIENPLDVVHSNNYIQLQNRDDYVTSMNRKLLRLLNPSEVVESKNAIKMQNRIYIPYNESYPTSRDQMILKNFVDKKEEPLKHNRISAVITNGIENKRVVKKESPSEMKHVIEKKSDIETKREIVGEKFRKKEEVKVIEKDFVLDEKAVKENENAKVIDQIPILFYDKSNQPFRYAKDEMVTSRGISGIVGSIIKKAYNFHLRRKWLWFPRFVKKAGHQLKNIGEDLKDIDL